MDSFKIRKIRRGIWVVPFCWPGRSVSVDYDILIICHLYLFLWCLDSWVYFQAWRAATLCPFGGIDMFPSLDALLKNGKSRTLQAIELESGIGRQWRLWKWASYCASEVNYWTLFIFQSMLSIIFNVALCMLNNWYASFFKFAAFPHSLRIDGIISENCWARWWPLWDGCIRFTVQ